MPADPGCVVITMVGAGLADLALAYALGVAMGAVACWSPLALGRPGRKAVAG